MTARATLLLKTAPEELQKIEPGIDDISQAEDWAPVLEFNIKLLLDELCTNVINYAHSDDLIHDITIEIESDDELVKVEIVDDGRPFNPLIDAPEPDTDSDLEDRRIGGLGIYFVKTIADEAHYRREDGKNHVTLLKRRV